MSLSFLNSVSESVNTSANQVLAPVMATYPSNSPLALMKPLLIIVVFAYFIRIASSVDAKHFPLANNIILQVVVLFLAVYIASNSQPFVALVVTVLVVVFLFYMNKQHFDGTIDDGPAPYTEKQEQDIPTGDQAQYQGGCFPTRTQDMTAVRPNDKYIGKNSTPAWTPGFNPNPGQEFTGVDELIPPSVVPPATGWAQNSNWVAFVDDKTSIAAPAPNAGGI